MSSKWNCRYAATLLQRIQAKTRGNDFAKGRNLRGRRWRGLKKNEWRRWPFYRSNKCARTRVGIHGWLKQNYPAKSDICPQNAFFAAFSIFAQTPSCFAQASTFLRSMAALRISGSWNAPVEIEGNRCFVYNCCLSLATEETTHGR